MPTRNRTASHRLRARLRPKGQVTLPASVREALHIDTGDDVAFEVKNGMVTLVGLKAMPADQAWFWTDEWQAGEHEADQEIGAGEGTIHKSADAMFDALGIASE